MKPDALLSIAWWLWFVPALMVLPLPLQWYFALAMHALKSGFSSPIDGARFAILESTAVPFIFGFPPLVVISLLYGFLFWRHTERGVALTPRFRIPLYGSGLLAIMLALMALVAFSPGRREYGLLPRASTLTVL